MNIRCETFDIQKKKTMAQLQKLEVETEAKCPADKFYGIFKNNINLLATIFPDNFRSIQLLEGDGKSVGTLRLWKYVLGNSGLMSTKERVGAMDDANRLIKFVVEEADLLKQFKNFSATLKVNPKSGDSSSCSVKWTMEFEKANANVPTPTIYVDMVSMITKGLGPHLAKA